jgi:hypothetical protein
MLPEFGWLWQRSGPRAPEKNLVPVYFPTAGAGSGGLRRQVLPSPQGRRIVPQEYDRNLTRHRPTLPVV